MILVLALPVPGWAGEPVSASRSWGATLLEPFEALSHWISALLTHDEGFVVDELERFRRVVDTDLRAFDALVVQAGFHIASVSVEAAAVPQIKVSMAFMRRLSEPEKATLIARITNAAGGVGTIERSIVMTLLNAAESPYAVRSDGYRLSGVEIDVDIIPNVTFILSKGP
jgi:hypothetical protein